MRQLAGIDHRLQPRTVLGGALDRHQQRQQALPVSRAGVLLQGLAKRQVLGLTRGRQLGRVGRQKGEWGSLVLPVLGEIEMHPPNQVPRGMTVLKKRLHRELGFSQLGIKGLIHAAPQIGKDSRRQILGSDHRRRGCRNRVQLAFRTDRHRRFGLTVCDIRKSTQGGHVAHPERAPIRQCRRQHRADFVGAKPYQSMS